MNLWFSFLIASFAYDMQVKEKSVIGCSPYYTAHTYLQGGQKADTNTFLTFFSKVPELQMNVKVLEF
jgi:hypothetical protein